MQTYIAEQLGRPDDLVVRLPDPEGKERVPASAEPFARLKENLLNRLKLTSQPVSVIVPRTMAGGAASTRPVWPIQAPLAGVGILWVDDHPENNVRETAELERMGAVVTASVSTEEGMAALREGAYQVVLTDMVRGREPEAGLDFLRRLGRDRVTTPVIVYAARWASDPGAETRAKNAGALGCTNQPDRLQELIFQATGRDWTGRYLDLMAQIGFDDTDSLAVIRISPEVVAGALAERARDNRELYRVLTTAVDAITGCDYVQVFLGMTALDLAADHIGKGKEGYPRPDPGGVIGRAHSEGRTRSVPNVLQSEEYIRAEKSTMSELAIPILGEGKRAVGVLNLESPETNAFTTEQVRWLEALVAAYPFPRLIARIFMIHAERDRDRARQLARACEVAGVEGSGLAAFENANCYVVLLSPEAESSRLLHSGLAWALDRSASSSGKVQVIPVLLDRCEIPPMLRPFQLIDLSAGIAKGDDRLLEAIQERRFDPPWRARGAEEKDASQAARQQAEAAAARGREAFAGEEYAKAIAAFDEAISLAPRAGYYRERGLSNWYWHRYGEAIVDYNEALKMDPALGEAVWFGRGQVLAEAGRYEEAIADLERVLANRPESESAGYLYRAKGVARAGLGQAAEAQRDFDRSMSLAPENAWLYYSLAKFQEAAGDWDRAFANYALSLYKRIPKLNRRKLVDAVASVEGVTGKLAIDPEAVARQLDGPEKAILERARSAMRAGEYGLALLAAEVLRSSAAEGPETGLMRCVCHRRLGNFDMANTEVERLFEMSAPPPGAVVERGYARLRARDFDGARADFSAALNAGQDSADSTSSAEAFCGRALVSLRLGHVFQARESIRAALQLAPRNAECMLTRARILEEAGERAAAEAAYRDSLRADDPRLSTRERDGVLETLRHFGEEESLAE
jgi:tetratricopeptide (TPR) repeat protein